MKKMGNYVADELSLREENSDSMKERTFSNEHLDSVRHDLDSELFKEEAQQEGMEVSLEYSESVKHSRASLLSSLCFSVLAVPRRRRIVIGLAILIGIILIASVSASVSKNGTYEESSELRERMRQENGSSRFNNGGRGDGGGAGNGKLAQGLPDYFVENQSKNAFLGEDVSIPPFSIRDPVEDLDRFDFQRPLTSTPSGRLNPMLENEKRALPTNAWYQNILRLGEDQSPTKDHRVYTIPYLIDAAGDFAGIRAHATRLLTTNIQVEVQIDEPWGLTLGAMSDISAPSATPELDKGYTVVEATDLGLTLQWDSYMKTTLVRGSPYVTMTYDLSEQDGILPTMHWKLDTSELPIIDGSRAVDCSSEPVFTVERDLEVVFFNSNQRWILFFSRPVQLRCQNDRGRPTIFQVTDDEEIFDDDDLVLIIRGALVVSSSSEADDDESFSQSYTNQLRASADVYPGESTSVIHSFNEENNTARISFDWDAQSMSESHPNITSATRNGNQMISFALPHHRETLSGRVSPTLCTTSILGPACLVQGNVWNMYEKLPAVDFRAPRHPDPKYLPLLAQALVEDIRYEIPSNFQSGASDTYFSGKTTAKLARILLITEEVKELCADASPEYVAACNNLELPSDVEIEDALTQLRDSVTVWVRTNTEAPFVYDRAWGGLVNCGCLYNGGKCTNVFPDCPAFNDQGLNFGNAFYNDHHFHYGYHIYSAAALAHFDSAWAMELYEDVALLARDYANPSDEDTAFPLFRNKDWYRGHSWAGGITNPMFRNLMNQESASEAVMAYEAVALFGKTMASIYDKEGDFEKAYVADMMHKIGLTLTATEIRSTQKYWQVRQNAPESERIYPEAYGASVVGILWETFAQFTTWFGNSPYLIYGIQLLPITPIAEARDAIEWANEIYGPLSQSCDLKCVSEGWSIQVNAILATIGRVQEAVEGILSVPAGAYKFAGGNGHSKSNALWYVSTRPGSGVATVLTTDVETIDIDEEESNTTAGEGEESESSSGDDFFSAFDDISTFEDDVARDEFLNEESESNDNNFEIPISGDNDANNDFSSNAVDGNGDGNDDGDDQFDADDFDSDNFNADDFVDNDNVENDSNGVGLNCFNSLCTDIILNTDANGYSCGDRIMYLMNVLAKPEFDACQQVAVTEYPAECGFCGPNV